MNKSPRAGPQEWLPIIDGQRTSGLTVAAYCLERGITQGSFYTWNRRLRQPAKRKRTSKPAFVEVSPPRAETAGTFEIGLRGGRHLLVRHGFDHDLLIDLIRTLEALA